MLFNFETHASLMASFTRNGRAVIIDFDVDLSDYAVLADCWAGSAAEAQCNLADIDRDDDIDVYDLAVFASAWCSAALP